MIRETSEAMSPQGIGCGGGTATWLKNASASLPSGDINEDTLETENAAAAAAAAFTASTDLKEAVLGRSALSIAPWCQLHHPSVPQPCAGVKWDSPSAVVQSCWGSGGVLLWDVVPGLPGTLSQRPGVR